MRKKFTIEYIPNEQGFDRFTIETDNGRYDIPSPPVQTTNDSMAVVKKAAEFLADCLSDQVDVYPVSCRCGWSGMSNDCRYLHCPDCGVRVMREIETPKPITRKVATLDIRDVGTFVLPIVGTINVDDPKDPMNKEMDRSTCSVCGVDGGRCAC